MKSLTLALIVLIACSGLVSSGPVRHRKRNTEVIVVENNGPGGYSRNRPGWGNGPIGGGFGGGFGGPGYGPGYGGGGGFAGGVFGGVGGGGPRWVAKPAPVVELRAPVVAPTVNEGHH